MLFLANFLIVLRHFCDAEKTIGCIHHVDQSNPFTEKKMNHKMWELHASSLKIQSKEELDITKPKSESSELFVGRMALCYSSYWSFKISTMSQKWFTFLLSIKWQKFMICWDSNHSSFQTRRHFERKNVFVSKFLNVHHTFIRLNAFHGFWNSNPPFSSPRRRSQEIITCSLIIIILTGLRG